MSENSTNRQVPDGGKGSDATLDLGHLTNLLLESHSRKKVFDTIFNGSIGILVHAIHVLQSALPHSSASEECKEETESPGESVEDLVNVSEESVDSPSILLLLEDKFVGQNRWSNP